MKRLRSIRLRFTAWYLIILAILLGGMSAGVYTAVSATLRGSIDDALRLRFEQVAAMPNVKQRIEEGRFESVLGEIVAVFTLGEEGVDVVSTRPIEELVDERSIDRALAEEPFHITEEGTFGQSLRIYLARRHPFVPGRSVRSPDGESLSESPPVGNDSGVGRVPPSIPLGDGRSDVESEVLLIAQPMDRTLAALGTLRTALWIGVPLSLLLSAGGGLFLVRRALRPVDRMTEAARGIEESDLERRVLVEADDELGRLARTLNGMLDRIERAFRRQRQFTDDASHELRSPLSVIEAEATLALRRERPGEDYREALAVIAEEAAAMNRLIDQLLTLARADAGRESLEREALDLADITRDVAEGLRPVAQEKGVVLVDDRLEPAELWGDSSGLRRLVTNLVENAIHYTPREGVVRLLTRVERSAAVLEVIDNGCGIDEADVQHIFERFYRADRARERAAGGSGLGLAICRTIVAAHGGGIDVKSRPGAGSRFVVHLPIRPEQRA